MTGDNNALAVTEDNACPSGAWKFTGDVVKVFDEMVRRSVPYYDDTLDLVADFYKYHRGKVVDLGCATGAVWSRMVEKGCQFDGFVGVDNSEDMLDRFRVRIEQTAIPTLDSFRPELVNADLSLGLPDEALHGRLYVCLWTAQFVPLELRQRLFAQIYRQCKDNSGGFILAEKIRGQTARFQDVLVENYHKFKQEKGGYSVQEIADKNRSLAGSLVSYSAPEIKNALNAEGFKVEEIIGYLSFRAWYCYT